MGLTQLGDTRPRSYGDTQVTALEVTVEESTGRAQGDGRTCSFSSSYGSSSSTKGTGAPGSWYGINSMKW